MKYFIFILVFFVAFLSTAQNNSGLEGLVTETESAVGEELLSSGIELSDAFLEAGMNDRSAKAAARVLKAARKQRRPHYEAIALNRMGKALEAAGDMDAAFEKYGESLAALEAAGIEDEALKKENTDRLTGGAFNFAFKPLEGKHLGAVTTFTDSLEKRIVVFGPGDFKIDIPLPADIPPVFRKTVRKKDMGQRCESVYNKILEINRAEVVHQLAQLPKPTTAPVAIKDAQSNPDWERWAVEQTKDLWQEKKVKIDEDIARNFQRLETLDQDALWEELLLTDLQNRYDSLAYLHKLDSISLEKKELALREKEAVIGEKRTHKSLMMVSTGGSSMLALLLLLGFVQQRKNNRLLLLKNSDIAREQQRSQELLLNILPATVAAELKEKGCASARRFESATVLFTDFKDFSSIAEHLPPEQLVAELDHCFKAFDDIVDKHGLEKIKTIGDSYMCVGGLEASEQCSAANVVKAAQAMQDFLTKWNLEKTASNAPYFEARIGIHTGPVIAGVVGARKFAYDIWGDTVNVASRMESSGEAGRINISGSTYGHVKSYFNCQYRGKIHAKNKGEVDMYFVEGAIGHALA